MSFQVLRNELQQQSYKNGQICRTHFMTSHNQVRPQLLHTHNDSFLLPFLFFCFFLLFLFLLYLLPFFEFHQYHSHNSSRKPQQLFDFILLNIFLASKQILVTKYELFFLLIDNPKNHLSPTKEKSLLQTQKYLLNSQKTNCK